MEDHYGYGRDVENIKPNYYNMILLNAGLPVIFFEYPAMIIGLLAVITIEYRMLKKSGFTLAPVLWSNIASTLVGIPLSYMTRVLIANDVIKGSADTDPFENSIFLGDTSYEGSFLVVFAIILVFNYIFSVLIEWGIYRLTYKTMPGSLLFRKTLIANLVSYIAMALFMAIIFFYFGLR
jgi:hypothetical protein